MIQSRQEYLEYLKQDSIALGKMNRNVKFLIKNLVLPDYVFRFQKILRRLEYLKNCKSTFFAKIEFIVLYFYFTKLSLKLGFSIPLNVFGPGLAIVHYGTIVVNANAKVGANCRIHPSTCIGASGGSDKAPQIGENVYIAPGVKIYGDIVLGNNIATAANAAVASSFLEENILVGGIPAVKIKNFDVSKVLKHLR